MRKNNSDWLSKQKGIGAITLFMVFTLLLVCSPSLAHNVTVFAWVEGDTVHVESKFSGGRRPVDAPVEVYDTQGNLLLEGLTDDKGEFSFKVPKKEELKVVLLAGMGHKGEWTIQPAEFGNDRAGPPRLQRQPNRRLRLRANRVEKLRPPPGKPVLRPQTDTLPPHRSRVSSRKHWMRS